jgi:hypothetical protein
MGRPKKQQEANEPQDKTPREEEHEPQDEKATKLGLRTPLTEHDDLPVVYAIGWARVRGGWVAMKFQVQGGEVIPDTLESYNSAPVSRASAGETLKIKLVTDFLPMGFKIEA